MQIPSEPQIFWSMMEAIGSVGAVVLALFFSMHSYFWNWWNRPKLIVEICDNSYFENDPSYPSLSHRLRVRNDGRITAKDVRVKINKIEYVDKNAKQENKIYISPFLVDKINLHWKDHHSFTAIFSDDVYECIGIVGNSSEFFRADCIITLIITGENIQGFESKWKYVDDINCYDTKLEKISK